MAEMAPHTPAEKQPAKPPEWLTKHEAGMDEVSKKFWDSAYSKLDGQNHYLKNEGPRQALERMKTHELLGGLSIGDIAKEAKDKVKTELGKNGELHRNYYTSKDQVLTPEQQQKEVGALVEHQKKHQQAERLTPTDKKIGESLTPDVAAQMKKAGLEVNPNKLHDGMVRQMENDKGLNSAGMEKMKGFPVGSPYVATGAASAGKMEQVLAKQKSDRDAEMKKPEYQGLSAKELWTNRNWQEYAKNTDVGHLLREDAKGNSPAFAKIEAADALIKKLQQAEKPKS